MDNQELLKAVRQMMQEELNPVMERLDKLEEVQEELRSGVNRLINWADQCDYVIKFPLPKI